MIGKIIYYKSDKIETIEQITNDLFLINGKEMRKKYDIIMLQNDGIAKFEGFTMCAYCGEIDSYVTDKELDMCYCDKCNMCI